MTVLKISTVINDEIEVLTIYDIDGFLEKLRNDPSVAKKYKEMGSEEFMEWAKTELTPRQFEKLQKINDL